MHVYVYIQVHMYTLVRTHAHTHIFLDSTLVSIRWVRNSSLGFLVILNLSLIKVTQRTPLKKLRFMLFKVISNYFCIQSRDGSFQRLHKHFFFFECSHRTYIRLYCHILNFTKKIIGNLIG